MALSKKIGHLIQKKGQLKNKDGRLKKEDVLGINIDKFFMPSVANLNGTDLTKYKVVKKGQFACNRMHVGRDERLPIALSRSDTDFLVSNAYDVFQIKDTSIVLPEYLMMWFQRKEFDRETWFYTDSDVRGKLDWNDFMNMELPVPSIQEQQKIVDQYQTVTKLIEQNQLLNEKLEQAAMLLYKHWFVNFEFPDAEGKPYQSSGGEMVYNDELDMEIPVDWEVKKLSTVLKVRYGKSYSNLGVGTIPLYGSGGVMGYVDTYIYNKPTVLIPRKGTLSNVMYVDTPFWSIDTMYYSEIKDLKMKFYIYKFLTECRFEKHDIGSAVPSLNTALLNNLDILIPPTTLVEKFNSIHERPYQQHKENVLLNSTLTTLCRIFESNMKE